MKNIIICSLLLVGVADSATLCMAGGKTSPEFLAVSSIAGSITLNLEANSNAPLNWQQVTQYADVNKLNRQLSKPRKIFVLQEHYVFITNKWIISQARNRQVVLVRNQPRTSYEGNIGRYLVCWNGDVAQALGMSETDFQKSLAQSGMKLPEPDPAEVAAAKAAVEALFAKEQWEQEVIVATAPKLTWADICTAWGQRIKSWFVAPAASGGQVRVVPVALVVLSLLAIGFWLFRKGRHN